MKVIIAIVVVIFVILFGALTGLVVFFATDVWNEIVDEGIIADFIKKWRDIKKIRGFKEATILLVDDSSAAREIEAIAKQAFSCSDVSAAVFYEKAGRLSLLPKDANKNGRYAVVLLFGLTENDDSFETIEILNFSHCVERHKGINAHDFDGVRKKIQEIINKHTLKKSGGK